MLSCRGNIPTRLIPNSLHLSLMEAFLTNILFSLFAINFIQTYRNHIHSAALTTCRSITNITVLTCISAIFCPERFPNCLVLLHRYRLAQLAKHNHFAFQLTLQNNHWVNRYWAFSNEAARPLPSCINRMEVLENRQNYK